MSLVLALWQLPVTATSLIKAKLFERGRRTCSIDCEYYNDQDELVKLNLVFEDVEAFKRTYEYACTHEMLSTYSKVVVQGETPWLEEVRGELMKKEAIHSGGHGPAAALRHLMIYIDGPGCFEFVCRDFRVEEVVEKETVA